MKKYVYLLACLIGYTVAYSQTITLEPRVINKGAPNADDPNGNYNIETFSKITNNSTDAADSMLYWKVINMAQPTTWQLDFCDPLFCRTDASQNDSFSFKLLKGNSGFMKADYYFHNTSGLGSVKVIIGALNNPANIDTLTINVNSWVTGVSEVNKIKSISFFPNPVKDQLTMKFAAKGDITIDIYNVLGTRVKSFTHSGLSSQTNISDLQNGVYFVRFSESGKMYTKQFIKVD